MTNYDTEKRESDLREDVHKAFRKNKYNKLIGGLIKQYMSEGMSEFDARMRAIMSDESLAMVYPNGYDK